MKNIKLKTKEREWLAGFFDADGSILVYIDHVSLEITTSIDDEGTLFWIKKNFGGSITLRSGAKAHRWRSRKKNVVLKILNELNGYLFNPIRINQFKKALNFYGISFLESSNNKVIALDSSYLSGFFDGDGSISLVVSRKHLPKNLTNISNDYGKVQRLIYSRGNNQLQIKCVCKEQIVINNFIERMGFGNLVIEKSNSKRKNKIYHWVIYKSDVYKFLDYVYRNPLRGAKKKRRFHLIEKYLNFKQNKYHLSKENTYKFKEWVKFCYKWYNIQS